MLREFLENLKFRYITGDEAHSRYTNDENIEIYVDPYEILFVAETSTDVKYVERKVSTYDKTETELKQSIKKALFYIRNAKNTLVSRNLGIFLYKDAIEHHKNNIKLENEFHIIFRSNREGHNNLLFVYEKLSPKVLIYTGAFDTKKEK